jgi:outer membrane protein
MNNLIKHLVSFFLLFIILSANAQNMKFGHIELQALIQVLPELKTAEAELNKYQKELEDVLAEMQQNYQTSLRELENLGEDASEVKRNAKISDLQNLQQRIQDYQQNAQQQVQQKYQELLNPLYEKATGAIEEVARELDLLYVFETGSRVILYHSNQSIDLLPLAKQKLGIEK